MGQLEQQTAERRRREKIQQKIAELVRESHAARKKAKELLEEAKRKVEELIEVA